MCITQVVNGSNATRSHSPTVTIRDAHGAVALRAAYPLDVVGVRSLKVLACDAQKTTFVSGTVASGGAGKLVAHPGYSWCGLATEPSLNRLRLGLSGTAISRAS